LARVDALAVAQRHNRRRLALRLTAGDVDKLVKLTLQGKKERKKEKEKEKKARKRRNERML
jgi:hypothetical protein